MAADERFENFVSAERDDTAIVRMRLVVFFVIGREAVIEACSVIFRANRIEPLSCHHFPQVPKFHRLVFGITDNVATVAFAVDISQALSVANQSTCFAAITHGTSVPDLDRRVIGTRVKNVRGGLVAVTDCVYIIAVAVDSEGGLTGFDVIDVDTFVRGTGYNLSSVA